MRLVYILSILSGFVFFACGEDETSDPSTEMDAGESAGADAGESAGTNAGESAGETAGIDAGEMAGESAGDDAGEMAGTEAGMSAGEMAGTEAGMNAGEMAGTDAGTEMRTDYHPDTQLNQLDEMGQQAFCASNIERGEANMLGEMELDQYIQNLCLIANIAGTESQAECEAGIVTCEMELRNLMFSVDQCLSDRVEQFMTCGATVSDIETCEDAIRDQVYNAVLNFEFDTILGGSYDCSTTEDELGKAGFLISAQSLASYPAACSSAAQSCIDLE